MTDKSLESALEDLIALLREFGEDRWADRLSTDLRLISRGDGYGLERLLSSFGGMGGLADLVIHPMNGHHIAESDVDRVNRQLVDLVEQVMGRARALRHATRAPDT